MVMCWLVLQNMSCSETCFLQSPNNHTFLPRNVSSSLCFVALIKGFLWTSATNAASRTGLDTCHTLILWHLPTCLSVWYFVAMLLLWSFGHDTIHLLHFSVISFLSKNDDVLANRSVMVCHSYENETGKAWSSFWDECDSWLLLMESGHHATDSTSWKLRL